MEVRAGVYEPTFSRYFLDQIARQRQLPYHAEEGQLTQEELHIKRYLFASQVMEQGRDLLRGWADNSKATSIEARAILLPTTAIEFERLREDVFPPYPFRRSRQARLILKYRAFGNIHPRHEDEELAFAWSQGRKLRYKLILNFEAERKARARSEGEGLRVADFEAMDKLAQAINFFSAEASQRESVVDDYHSGEMLVAFRPRPVTPAQAA